MKEASLFARFARSVADASGQPATFLVAIVLIFVWAVSGPLFDFNDTWQLTVNTGTTIVTFLMVFLIQNTQNRDSKAMQAKLDELIKASEGARNAVLDMEKVDEAELEEALQNYAELAKDDRMHSHEHTHHPATGKPEKA